MFAKLMQIAGVLVWMFLVIVLILSFPLIFPLDFLVLFLLWVDRQMKKNREWQIYGPSTLEQTGINGVQAFLVALQVGWVFYWVAVVAFRWGGN